MEAWCAQLLGAGERNRLFARALMEEEDRKLTRLATLSKSIGLPVNPTYVFTLPKDTGRVIGLCSDLEQTGWKVSFRLMNGDGRLVFRDVNAEVPIVAAAMAGLAHSHKCTARVSPYKEPTISGTVLVTSGDARLEMVYGPHYWLTKGAPQGVSILSCWYRFPHVAMRYSTDNATQRTALFAGFRDVVRIALGVSIRALPEMRSSLYAEYHWRSDIGYRFLECSCSWAWTGGMSPG